MESEKAPVSIIKADIQDIDDVWNIIQNCSAWLAEQGLTHWSDYYTKQMFEQRLNGEEYEVYLMYDRQGNAVATASINTHCPEYYGEDVNQFTEPSEQAIYLTAIGVDPQYQGKGYAKEMLSMVEGLAKTRQIPFVRFDARASYTKLIDFYKKQGYKIVGSLLDDLDEENPQSEEDRTYYLMEKSL